MLGLVKAGLGKEEMDHFTLPPPCQHSVSISDVKNDSSLRFQLAVRLGRESTVHSATTRPSAPHFTGGDSEAGGGGAPAYHVHLDEQDPQGEVLPQALQPLVDVVWVQVVVAEAGGRGEEGIGSPSALSMKCRELDTLLGAELREVK